VSDFYAEIYDRDRTAGRVDLETVQGVQEKTAGARTLEWRGGHSTPRPHPPGTGSFTVEE